MNGFIVASGKSVRQWLSARSADLRQGAWIIAATFLLIGIIASLYVLLWAIADVVGG